MESLLEDLNEAQREAVAHGEGPLLVVAGAGSGKTRVITRRIAWLLAHGVTEREILGLTFTNKAAREMAGRVEDLLPGSWVRLSTFHSACARFLRRSGERIGFGPDFSIKDVQDRNALIKQIMGQLDIPYKAIRPSLVGNIISGHKNQGLLPGDPALPCDSLIDEYVSRIYGPYQEALADMNAMDFDDLLLHMVRVLEESPEERESYRRRFRYILVDEFQDTNRIQYRLLQLLLGDHNNLCVVGDPDQSIYRFRGAEIGNILGFPQDFEGTKIVKLEDNYRSTATILDFAQKVISHNTYRHEKVLKAVLPEGEPVGLVECADTKSEAREVVRRIGKLMDRGVPPTEIAVFYRGRFSSRGLEDAFRRSGLPFQIVGDLSFFERKEIKDLLSFLQVCANPRDRISLSRILNVPTRGIGKTSEARIYEEAARQGLAPAELLRRGMEIPGLRGKAKKGVKELGVLLEESFPLSLESVEATLKCFLDRTDYLDWICEAGTYADVDREDNVKELLVHGRNFDREADEDPSLGLENMGAVPLYLSQVSLMTERLQGDAPVDGVQLMTVHAAKGLEFDHVFLVGLEEGLFPHSRSLDQQEDIEEERRLFYVAATRARREFTCLYAVLRESYEGGFRANDPSRFLTEGELLQAKRHFGDEHLEAQEAPQDYSDEPGWQEPVYRYDSPATKLPEPDPLAANQSYKSGERVAHKRFGAGTILRAFGSGASAKVEVLFESGIRTLLLEYANLERLEGC